MYTLSACGGWFAGDESERIKEAYLNNFKAVELLLWNKADLNKMKLMIEKTGVKNSAILIQSKDPAKQKMLENTHGIVWEDTKDVFIDAMHETLQVAEFLDVNTIIITSGNERKDVSREKCHEIMVDAIKEAAKIVEGTNVQIVLEPLNILVDHPGYYLVSTKEGIDIIHEVNHPNVKLLFDIYHQQISEGNIIRNLIDNIDDIGHIHVADNPGRNEPGTGEINYKNIFNALKNTNYNGYVVFECGRTDSAEVVCKKMLELGN